MCVHLFFLLVELIGDTTGVCPTGGSSTVFCQVAFMLDDRSWNDSGCSLKNNRNRLDLVDSLVILEIRVYIWQLGSSERSGVASVREKGDFEKEKSIARCERGL